MEVIEHVTDPADFAKTCAAMVKPGGLMFVATLNRTLKAFGLAILGAEYVLGWLPKGTHQWEKFITPDELKTWLAEADCPVQEVTGVTYSPLSNTWRKAADTDVNYMLVEIAAESTRLSALSSPRPAVWAAAARQCLLRAAQRHP